MQEISVQSAAIYLRATGRVSAGAPIEIRELPGGVSNLVLLIELPEQGERFVLKQARGRLRVKEDWQCSVERIWREVETLRLCGSLLEKWRATFHGRAGGVRPRRQSTLPGEELAAYQPTLPSVLWEDRDNYAYAMSAAPLDHKTWKELLLAGELPQSTGIALACGQMLGALHAGSWQSAVVAARLDERSFFDQLRLDPYYRQVARVHPELAAEVERLVDSVWSHRLCLVHGDFSPKNLLVSRGQVMLIDFEVGHYGDPAFDLGFFLTHLVLKSIWSGTQRADYLRLAETIWDAYRQELSATVSVNELAALELRACWNLAVCMLARVDGKSPVDYLAPEKQEEVRSRSVAWIRKPPATFQAALDELAAGC